MKKAIAYYRVSTDRQGKSGLGLEAQAEAVSNFAEREGMTSWPLYGNREREEKSTPRIIRRSRSVSQRTGYVGYR